MRMISALLFLGFAFLAPVGSVWAAGTPGGVESKGGAHTQAQPPSGGNGLTAEERMDRRFPQNVRTAELLGLPIIDYDDRILGHVMQVVRTADGKIILVVFAGGWFGWGSRPVPVPIETVGLLGRQIALLDIPRALFFKLSTWTGGAGDMPVDPDQMIRIALTRR